MRLSRARGDRKSEGLEREKVVARLSVNLMMCRLDCASAAVTAQMTKGIREIWAVFRMG
jgi:hypothetical protein